MTVPFFIRAMVGVCALYVGFAPSVLHAESQTELMMRMYQKCFNSSGQRIVFDEECEKYFPQATTSTTTTGGNNTGGTSNGGSNNSGGGSGGMGNLLPLMMNGLGGMGNGMGGFGGMGNGMGGYGAGGAGGYGMSPATPGGGANGQPTDQQSCIPTDYATVKQAQGTLAKANALINQYRLGTDRYAKAPCQGKNCECASLGKELACVTDPASTWKPGLNIKDNAASIPAGTLIATFNNGAYGPPHHPGGWYGQSHTCIFMGITSNGFKCLEQYNSLGGARLTTIPWNRPGMEGADKYHIVQTQSGKRCDSAGKTCEPKKDEKKKDEKKDEKTDEKTPPSSNDTQPTTT